MMTQTRWKLLVTRLSLTNTRCLRWRWYNQPRHSKKSSKSPKLKNGVSYLWDFFFLIWVLINLFNWFDDENIPSFRSPTLSLPLILLLLFLSLFSSPFLYLPLCCFPFLYLLLFHSPFLYFPLSHSLSLHPFSLGCRILHLCEGVRPLPSAFDECPGYDIKLHLMVNLQFWI